MILLTHFKTDNVAWEIYMVFTNTLPWSLELQIVLGSGFHWVAVWLKASDWHLYFHYFIYKIEWMIVLPVPDFSALYEICMLRYLQLNQHLSLFLFGEVPPSLHSHTKKLYLLSPFYQTILPIKPTMVNLNDFHKYSGKLKEINFHLDSCALAT